MYRTKYLVPASFVVLLAAVSLLATGCGKEEPTGPTSTPAGTTAPSKTPATPPAKAADAEAVQITQKLCPVMGGEIDKSIYTDYEGRRVYFCCEMCVDTFKNDPAKYLKKLDEQMKSGE